MFILVIFIALVAGCQGQSSACKYDSQCSTGHYCDVDTHFCRECLSCEDLKRDPPKYTASCIKSVVECGPCQNGLVEDILGDVSAQCVESRRADEGMPAAYIWTAVGAGIFLFIVVVAIVIYVLRNTDTFKVLASTRTSVQRSCIASANTAPEPPPPYNQYEPVRPSSPPAPLAPPYEQDPESPFIKQVPSYIGGEARESDGSQAARVFNNPSYVRGPHLSHTVACPPGYYEGGTLNDESDREVFTVHDEDTMESVWTPGASRDHNGNAEASHTASNEPVSTNVATRPACTDLAPPAKVLCIREDNNNNNNSRNRDSDPQDTGVSSSAATSIIVNVVQNINTLQQRNDVKL